MTSPGGICSASSAGRGLSRSWRGATKSVPTSRSTETCWAAARPRSRPEADVGGIAGCYQQADGQKIADTMADRIAHRGPDAAGSWSHESETLAVHLAFRRLSIIDLSDAANQPFRKHDLVLIYNGEVYNFRALR